MTQSTTGILFFTIFLAACGGSDSRRPDEPTMRPVPSTVTTTTAAQSNAPPNTAEPSSMPAPYPNATSGADDTSEMPPTPGSSSTSRTLGDPPSTWSAGTPGSTMGADDTRDFGGMAGASTSVRAGAAPVAAEQGKSAAERNITASIRRSVMADRSLSTLAKNVKITTLGGKVTLRGKAKDDAERRAIESIARKTTGVAEVADEIEITK
jgi:hypothetical protein